MEFCHSYLFVTFVVMTVDQIVGRMMAGFDHRKGAVISLSGLV